MVVIVKTVATIYFCNNRLCPEGADEAHSIKSGDFVDYMDASEAERYRDYWAKVYAKDSPVEIPSDAKVKAEFKKAGYDQFIYSWKDGTHKWKVRWHTKTPNAPSYQGTSWVVKRDIISDGSFKPYSEFFIQDNTWIKGKTWFDAIGAKKAGNPSSEQIEILDKGHWPWPDK